MKRENAQGGGQSMSSVKVTHQDYHILTLQAYRRLGDMLLSEKSKFYSNRSTAISSFIHQIF